MIRKATLEDLSQLTTLHFNNFDKNELSIILGKKFIESFYKLALSQSDVTIRVIEENGQLKGSSMYFLQYKSFEEKFRNQNLSSIISFLITNFLTLRWSTILFLLKSISSKKFANHVDPKIYNYYLGSFIIDKDSRLDSSVVINFYKMLTENVKELQAQNSNGFWGSCRKSNESSRGFLELIKMKPLTTISSFPEAIIIYTKP